MNIDNTSTDTSTDNNTIDLGYIGTRSRYVLMSPSGVTSKNPSGRATSSDLSSYWYLPCLEIMPNGAPTQKSGGLGATKIRELIAAGEEVANTDFSRVVVRPMIVSQGDPRTPVKGSDGFPLTCYTTSTAAGIDVDSATAFAGVARETARATWCAPRDDLGGRSYLDHMNASLSDEDQKAFDKMNAGRGAADKLERDLISIAKKIPEWMSAAILLSMANTPKAVNKIKHSLGSSLTEDTLDVFCRAREFTTIDRLAIVDAFFPNAAAAAAA